MIFLSHVLRCSGTHKSLQMLSLWYSCSSYVALLLMYLVKRRYVQHEINSLLVSGSVASSLHFFQFMYYVWTVVHFEPRTDMMTDDILCRYDNILCRYDDILCRYDDRWHIVSRYCTEQAMRSIKYSLLGGDW
jgi:hypothetical protein